MDTTIEQALARGGIVDITTTGRKSGEARRIEIYIHNIDGDLWLTGKPGFPRDWIANLKANPEMTLHLKRGVSADLPARGEVVEETGLKAEIITRARTESWGADPAKVQSELDHWVATSPLAKVDLI